MGCKMTAMVTLCGANQCFRVARSLVFEINEIFQCTLSKIDKNLNFSCVGSWLNIAGPIPGRVYYILSNSYFISVIPTAIHSYYVTGQLQEAEGSYKASDG